jgi:lipopolysaccharide biosynthesis regulator YciM
MTMNRKIKRIKENNREAVEKLILMNKNAEHQNRKNSKYNVWVYSNMRITLLERLFLQLYASFNDKSNTLLFRTYINALMRRNPNMVEEAKRIIDSGEHDSYMKEKD